MTAVTQKPVLLVTAADLAPEAIAMLDAFELIFAGKQPTEDDIVALCEHHKPVAIIVRYGKINARIMDAAANLRVISKHGSGIDVIDQAAAKERVSPCWPPSGRTPPPSPSMPGRSSSLAPRRSPSGRSPASWPLGQGHAQVGRTGGPHARSRGLGAIGRRVAAVGLSFGMTVVAFDPYAKEAPQGVKLVSLEALYAASDVVSLHCPLTAENRQMLNRETLSCFKPGAILVNTARGGLIDEAALAQALASGQLRAAGLDSFDVEPMTMPHLFQGIPNVILSPHIGGVSDAAYVNMGKGAAANVLAVVNAQARDAA